VEFHSPVKAVVKPAVNLVDHLLTDTVTIPSWLAGTIMLVIALAGIFVALASLTRILKTIVLRRAEGSLSKGILRNDITAMAIGMVITTAVQSSSITTSLMVPMIGAGIIPLPSAFAVTLGANVGTTVTALLASMTGNLAAVTVALVHLLFNISGILLIYPIPAIRRIPVRLAHGLAVRASARRYYALLYVGGVFFLLPLVFVLVDKLIKKLF
jgi:sodium-dependent phosphate cotransporter